MTVGRTGGRGAALWICNRVWHWCLGIKLKEEFRGASNNHTIVLNSKVGEGVRDKDMGADG